MQVVFVTGEVLITALVSLHMINHPKAMVTQHMYACAQPINTGGECK